MSFFGTFDRDELLKDGWEKDATFQWGIPLHPQGELNAIDYLAQTPASPDEIRTRAFSIFMQLPFPIIINYIFMRNLAVSIRMVYQRPEAFAPWCCLLQASVGVIYTVNALLYAFPGGPSCRHAVWIVGVGITISQLCVGATLLQKAYIVHHRNKRLLVLGITLLLPQPLIIYFVWISPVIMAPPAGCLACYPHYFPWVKFAMDMPINILFSVAFISVVYRQYRQFGTAAWARLVRNGIRTMCLIVISNFVCMICAAFEVLSLLSQMFMLIDWIITSLLMIHHCENMRVSSAATKDSHKADGRGIFSHIETETSVFERHSSDENLRARRAGRKFFQMIR
ncbi:hypothetical protein THASP1DRAFT_21994 [Thamnocephalis sphaerospora]|uniref:Uncharacterized protein n=1 Tax=Thamnocephalis sphaerospora TaxID=78915 RepID=A0A4P9XLZ7_9FUNG|nr:hypothetical protein THASP1DRAFT_31270 [Thamnocephalis sphaerospora]RKP10256.1 hypothetical protein THASP1DRAFT_21994 [Thamnocephalis sphaerospora]|eukprot:RKP06918.1 hypothetical protein THASP1DRAFT_31270 [Thamnocephalis sphaerospora]